jgi:hypothetical protein
MFNVYRHYYYHLINEPVYSISVYCDLVVCTCITHSGELSQCICFWNLLNVCHAWIRGWHQVQAEVSLQKKRGRSWPILFLQNGSSAAAIGTTACLLVHPKSVAEVTRHHSWRATTHWKDTRSPRNCNLSAGVGHSQMNLHFQYNEYRTAGNCSPPECNFTKLHYSISVCVYDGKAQAGAEWRITVTIQRLWEKPFWLAEHICIFCIGLIVREKIKKKTYMYMNEQMETLVGIWWMACVILLHGKQSEDTTCHIYVCSYGVCTPARTYVMYVCVYVSVLMYGYVRLCLCMAMWIYQSCASYVWLCMVAYEYVSVFKLMCGYGMYVYVCVSQLVDMKGTMTAFGNIVHHGSISLWSKGWSVSSIESFNRHLYFAALTDWLLMVLVSPNNDWYW